VDTALGPSDHVTGLNAYDQWDRLHGERKFSFCRENFLGLRSMQAIAGLKRQLLEVLSDGGFVRRGLHARHVESQGRREDSDGVRVALLGRENADREEDPAAHQALVTALLCAALFPQVVAIEQPAPSKKKKKKGGGVSEGQPPKFFIREPGNADPVQVSIHPSSVNSKVSSFTSPYLVYHELVRTTKLYIRDATPVPPLALVLFGGALTAGKGSDRVGEVMLTVDGWIKFAVPRRLQSLLVGTREQLDIILKRKVEDPSSDFGSGAGLLAAVVQLLADASSLPPAGAQTATNMTKAQAWGEQAVKQWGQTHKPAVRSYQDPPTRHAPPPGLSSGNAYKPSFVPGRF